MSSFKPMFSTVNTGYTNCINICKEDSRYIWIENRLKATDLFTEVRILPALDENHEEELALNPEGGASEEQIPGTLGRVFGVTEIVDIWKGGKQQFVSSVQEFDSAGDPAPKGYTPAMRFMTRVGYKVYEQMKRAQAGLDTDAPEHWFGWREHNSLNKPQQMYILRVLTNFINGEAIKNAAGKPEWVPGIFAIPKSAEAMFIQNICTRLNPEEPLTLDNNEFGDFCSCEGGYTVRLKRYDKMENGKRTGTSYSLNRGRLMPIKVDEVASFLEPWDNILEIPTVEESISKLITLFDPVAIDYGFRGTQYDKYIPEDIKGASKEISEAGSIKDLGKKEETTDNDKAEGALRKTLKDKFTSSKEDLG